MELKLYSTIECTPGWYYRNFPGFCNIDCYKILAYYSQNPSKYKLHSGVAELKDTEEQEYEEERLNKKIRLDNNNNNGL